MVLGDRFGAACAPAVTQKVERELTAMGYRVTRNAPYAGGYTTEHYGRPARRTHALQVEINRCLANGVQQKDDLLEHHDQQIVVTARGQPARE